MITSKNVISLRKEVFRQREEKWNTIKTNRGNFKNMAKRSSS